VDELRRLALGLDQVVPRDSTGEFTSRGPKESGTKAVVLS
jgi:hypothetical protein